jgi:TonB family protein
MKRLLLTVLAGVLLHVGASAQTSGNGQASAQEQAKSQTSEGSSPELLEAEKLNIEVVKLFTAGQYDSAITLAKRVLQIREKTLAPGNELINSALINLAELYLTRQKYGEAERYYQRLLAFYEQAPAQDVPAIARILDRLAFLSYMQLEFDKAEKLYQRTIALREQAQGPDQLDVAAALYNLAEFYRFRGSYKKAEPLYQRAIEIKGKTLGPENKDVLKALDRYSCLYYSTNQMEKVKDLESQFSFFRPQDIHAEKEEILNGKAINLPKPEYPSEALRAGVSGTVVVKIMVDETGKVIKAEDMCSEHPGLTSAAVKAAYKALFTPTLRSGMPIKVRGVITYGFKTQK